MKVRGSELPKDRLLEAIHGGGGHGGGNDEAAGEYDDA